MTDGHVVDKRDLLAYALGLKGKIGTQAAQYARNRAETLLACNDAQGHRVWLEVAAIIEASDRTKAA